MNAAIASIYRAASGLDAWPAALSAINAAAGGMLGCQMISVNLEARAIVFSYASEGSPAEAEIEYIRAYHAVDPRIGPLIESKQGDWFYCQDHFDEERVANEPYYRDLLIPNGGRYSALTKLHQTGGEIVMIAFLSHLGTGPIPESARAALDAFAYHLREAVPIYLRNRDFAKAAVMGHQILERLPRAAFLVDPDGRLAFANAHAEKILEKGMPLLRAGGKLRAFDSTFDDALRQSMDGLLRESAAQPVPSRRVLSIPKHGREAGGAVSLTAFAPDSSLHAFGDLTQILIAIHERGALTEPDLALWQAAFDLTPAQARVAREIFVGHSVKQTARALMISESTVKTHLNDLFAKTGARRQAEVVRVLSDIGA